jgi:nickel-dependent lactate racemase
LRGSLLSEGGVDHLIDDGRLAELLDDVIEAGIPEGARKVLLIPPDHTRLYSGAGKITAYLYSKLGDRMAVDVMPALGTHVPMSKEEIVLMFGSSIPFSAFLPHRWRDDLEVLGEVPSSFIEEVSEGAVSYSMEVAVNQQLTQGNYDAIFSIGQVVPHEVIGMANYTKNILIGVGGGDSIHKSHFLGAAYGMERIMGRTDTPVRRVLDKAYDEHVAHLPITFLLTVMEKSEDDVLMRGFFAGKDRSCFEAGAKLSQQVNFDLLEEPIQKAVVYLDPREFKTTWLGNKAIYRLRMAMADEGELIILAPELHGFGEDEEIDGLIRKYGYHGTPKTLEAVGKNQDLKDNLSAAAHLIHGSSEGRFSITYCPGEGVTQEEIEGVGFKYQPYAEVAKTYDPEKLKDGWQELNGERIFYVSNPALGLWALRGQFQH